MSALRLVRRLVALFTQGPLEALTELVSDDAMDHNPLPFQPPGREGVAWKLAFWRAEAPQARSWLERLAATPEGAVARWSTELTPDGPSMLFEGHFFVRDGRITSVKVKRVADRGMDLAVSEAEPGTPMMTSNMTHSISTAHWLQEAVAYLTRLATSGGPALQRRLLSALECIGRMNSGTNVADELLRPASTPFISLLDACAADLGLAGDPRVALVGRSTVLLYAYVRIQDNLVDEPQEVDRASTYAAEVLLAEHLSLLARVVAHPRLFMLRGVLMRRFAEVSLAEVDSRGHLENEDAPLDWMGEKFLPMAVPLVALADIAGELRHTETLTAFVIQLGTGLQLVNDVLNVAEDHGSGRTTPLLRWLAKEGSLGEQQGAPLRAVLLAGHPALKRALSEARRHVEAAERLAAAEGLPAMSAVAHATRAHVEQAPERLMRLLLGSAM
jgi:hypothetical protein